MTLKSEERAALVEALENDGGAVFGPRDELHQLGLCEKVFGPGGWWMRLTPVGRLLAEAYKEVAQLQRDKAQMRNIIVANGRALARAGLVASDDA